MNGLELTPSFLLWLIVLGLGLQTVGLFLAAYFMALTRDNGRTVLSILSRAQEYRGIKNPSAKQNEINHNPRMPNPRPKPKPRVTIDEMVDGIAAGVAVPDPPSRPPNVLGRVCPTCENDPARRVFPLLSPSGRCPNCRAVWDGQPAGAVAIGEGDNLLETCSPAAAVLAEALLENLEAFDDDDGTRHLPPDPECDGFAAAAGRDCPLCFEKFEYAEDVPEISEDGVCPECGARWVFLKGKLSEVARGTITESNLEKRFGRNVEVASALDAFSDPGLFTDGDDSTVEIEYMKCPVCGAAILGGRLECFNCGKGTPDGFTEYARRLGNPPDPGEIE